MREPITIIKEQTVYDFVRIQLRLVLSVLQAAAQTRTWIC
jgi:hypothetical protein